MRLGSRRRQIQGDVSSSFFHPIVWRVQRHNPSSQIFEILAWGGKDATALARIRIIHGRPWQLVHLEEFQTHERRRHLQLQNSTPGVWQDILNTACPSHTLKLIPTLFDRLQTPNSAISLNTLLFSFSLTQ